MAGAAPLWQSGELPAQVPKYTLSRLVSRDAFSGNQMWTLWKAASLITLPGGFLEGFRDLSRKGVC